MSALGAFAFAGPPRRGVRRPAFPRSLGGTVRAIAGGVVALLTSACSSIHYPVNAPLVVSREASGYSIRNLQAEGNSDSLLVLVAFSGGGYRAAALSFAVMEALRDTPIEWEGRRTSLLDEVDFISAVSGGSLTAGYYALYRERLFQDFEHRVLSVDLQSAVWQKALSPAGLWQQTSMRYGRGDLLQEVLQEKVFGEATYSQVPRRRPLVFINAADMQFGDRFEFTQDQFDHICSDLDEFPLARAVAASMAVPVLFSPISLWNHMPDCRVSIREYALSSRAHRSRYIHLVDGGLADNTGVRAPLEIIGARGGIIRSARLAGLSGVSKRVFIVVNAQLARPDKQDQSADTPGSLQQLRRAVDLPIDRHSQSSIAQLRREAGNWKRELQLADERELAGAMNRNTDFHVIEVDLSMVDTHPEAVTLRSLSAGLRLDRRELAAMRSFARTALDNNAEWKELMRQLHTPRKQADENLPTRLGHLPEGVAMR